MISFNCKFPLIIASLEGKSNLSFFNMIESNVAVAFLSNNLPPAKYLIFVASRIKLTSLK